MPNDALIIVDVQNDFLPGGALAVPHGDEVVAVANKLMRQFELVVATQDWHPPNHGSFASQHPGRQVGETISLAGVDQILWPDHCVQDTHGAAFADALDQTRIDRVFPKGTDPSIDSYSGFFDNGHQRATGLGEFLREQEVRRTHVLGLATDYCVKFTALDARKLGFDCVLMTAGCRGVNLQPGDCDAALREMRAAGVQIS